MTIDLLPDSPAGEISHLNAREKVNELAAFANAPYINVTVTQNELNTYSVTGTGDNRLYPPSVPQPIVGGDYEGYVQVGNLENDNNYLMTVADGINITIPQTGRYRVDGFADFAHSSNNATVAFVFAINTGSDFVFSQRPVRHRVPNGADYANMAGEGVIMASDASWTTSLWVASDVSGIITVDTLSIIIAKFFDL